MGSAGGSLSILGQAVVDLSSLSTYEYYYAEVVMQIMQKYYAEVIMQFYSDGKGDTVL